LPLYEYKCEKCSHRFEKIEGFSASETKKCPKCGGKARRMVSASAIQFKGTGWYVTDYAGKKPGDSAAEKADTAGAKAEAKASDSKAPETKSSESKNSESKSSSSEKSEKASSEKGPEKASSDKVSSRKRK